MRGRRAEPAAGARPSKGGNALSVKARSRSAAAPGRNPSPPPPWAPCPSGYQLSWLALNHWRWIHKWEKICERDKWFSAVLTRNAILEPGKLFLYRLVKDGTFPCNVLIWWIGISSEKLVNDSPLPPHWSSCSSGTIDRTSQIFCMGDVFIPPYGFYFCEWSLKSFLCKIKLTLQGNMRQESLLLCQSRIYLQIYIKFSSSHHLAGKS